MKRALLAWSLLCGAAQADVVGLELERRELVLEGREFGEVGAYEKLMGWLHFALDPEEPYNARVVDLELAPRDDEGLVRARARFYALVPAEPERGANTLLLEVSNRGGKAMLGYFCRAAYAGDPSTERHFGDGWLFERGLSLAWVGWQHDVPREGDRLWLEAPVAPGVEGLVRSDWVVDQPTAVLDLAHRGHRPYPVLDPGHADNVLTVRDGRLAEREAVPRERWRFARLEDGEVVSDPTRVWLEGGFEAGKIYELVYRATDPAISGMGLTAIRDTLHWAKTDSSSPLAAEHTLALGISQTGRFLRHFLYQGFWRGRSNLFHLLDGALVHTAGAGRGSFNHRFAQPSRDAHRYSAFFYPTDLFPFSSVVQRDPVTGERDGLGIWSTMYADPPRVFFTNTGYEYWGRAASLLHTSLDGSADVDPPANERIYHLGSTQHFAVGFPPRGRANVGEHAWRGNPVDLLATERALLSALLDWVVDDVEPPPSRFPTISGEDLLSLAEYRASFPRIPGVRAPEVVHEAYRADYGPDFDPDPFLARGRIAHQPPRLGPPYASLVPAVDARGNELGGTPSLETELGLASYLPWHVRTGMPGGNGELTDFYGSFVPLPRTEAEREAWGDERPSIESRYASREAYIERAEEAADRLIESRFLLQIDRERVLARAAATWDWIHERP